MIHPRLTIPSGIKPQPQPMRVNAPLVDLFREPDGALDCQLLYGAKVNVHQEQDGWVFVQALADNYVGFCRAGAFAPPTEQSHRVSAFSSHRYTEPALKSKSISHLPFGAQISVSREVGGFGELPDGSFIPLQHIRPRSDLEDDFVAVFECFLGVPYLWGGDSIWGIDCSAAVQLSLQTCGIGCLRDTDMQENSLGEALADDENLQRGDFIFWRGHVGVMQDATRLIHANAHHMAVASEPLDVAVKRIAEKGDGPVISRRRLIRK